MSDQPPPLDPAGVISALEQHHVRYVVIGGIAAQLHGSTAPTRGLDLTPERSTPNLVRLAAALAAIQAREWVPGFGYPLQMPMDRRRLAGDRALLTQTRHGRVDVVPAPHGLPGGYTELQPRAPRVAAYGADVPIASLDDLMRSHAAAGRPKDKSALSRLIDLRLRSHEEPLQPNVLQPPDSLASPTLHDALAASERLAVVFDIIRPQVAYVRRELYRAVDSVMYGDAAAMRDSIDRARYAASRARADIHRLSSGRPTEVRNERISPLGPGSEGYERPTSLSHQADQELRVTLRILASAATALHRADTDELRDLLVEARVHAATADSQLDLLQIQLEHEARGWPREAAVRDDWAGRE